MSERETHALVVRSLSASASKRVVLPSPRAWSSRLSQAVATAALYAQSNATLLTLLSLLHYESSQRPRLPGNA